MSRLSRPAACILALASFILCCAHAYAGDDTARFYGTWKTTVALNGQSFTVISVHDAGGVKNYTQTATGQIPAGEGTFKAADGKWSSNAPFPNNGGVYRFVNNDTVIATNAVGQTVTWVRDKSAPAAAKAPTPVDANTAANRETGYIPPSGRPGASVTPPAPPSARAGAFSTPPPADAAEDAALSPNVKAGFVAYKNGDRVNAWRDFMADAQKGNSDAQAALGSMLFQMTNPPGTGFFKDCEKWLLLSAKQGNKHGMDMLAQYYYYDARNMAGGINPGVNNAPIPPELQRQADGRFGLARQWLEKSAAQGDVYAMANLSILLDSGVGGPRDPNRAAQLREQVQKGPDAQFAKHVAATDPASAALAASWQSGHYADAIKTAQANAAKGDAGSEALLGRAYYEGVGVPRNYAMALTWLNKAVAQNNADALFFLGMMNEYGRGIPQNLDQALKLFDRAAAQGQGYAKMEAAGMRQQGEINRQMAKMHSTGVLERACQTAGGIPDGSGLCMKGGGDIDPFNAEQAAGSGYESAPEPVYEPEPEP